MFVFVFKKQSQETRDKIKEKYSLLKNRNKIQDNSNFQIIKSSNHQIIRSSNNQTIK